MKLLALIVAGVLTSAAQPALADGGGGGGGGPDTATVPADPDFDAGVRAWQNKDWPQVIERMGAVIGRNAGNADAWNYRAYAYRQLGKLAEAFQHYERALAIDPKHRGAHEYLGEAYLQAGKLAEAEAQLDALDKLCWMPCEQYTDLKNKIAAYKQRTAAAR